MASAPKGNEHVCPCMLDEPVEQQQKHQPTTSHDHLHKKDCGCDHDHDHQHGDHDHEHCHHDHDHKHCDHDHDHKHCHHDHNHEHCDHNHEHCHHDHDHKHCDHDHDHDHQHCHHDHHHSHSHGQRHDDDYAPAFNPEGGCSCCHHDHDDFKASGSYAPLAKISTPGQALDSNLLTNDIKGLLKTFHDQHGKFYPSDNIYSSLGLIYGAVATSSEDMLAELLHVYLSNSNSKVDPSYLENSLKLAFYLQNNIFEQDFYVNNFFALLEKQDYSIAILKNMAAFIEGYYFAVQTCLPRHEDIKPAHFAAVNQRLQDLMSLRYTIQYLVMDFEYRIKGTDSEAEKERIATLDGLEIHDGAFSYDQELALEIVKDAIAASRNDVAAKERVDLALALALPVPEEEDDDDYQ